MSKDSMRFNLVTNFVCAKCGGPLMLSYDAPRTRAYHPEASDGITGAAKVVQNVAIHPCAKCYGDAVRPLELLKAALAS